jgi:putative heme-binding domain-containing protein
MQQLVGDKLREPEVPHDRRILLLRALGQCSLAQLPRSWIDGLAAAVGDSTASIQHAAVETAARLQIQQLDAVLIDLVENPDAPTPLRVEALGAVVVRHQILADSSFNLLVRLLDDGKNPLDRLAAAEVLGRAELSDSQLTVTLSRAPADPLVWPQLLPAFRNSSSPELGFALVHRLRQLAESQIFRPSPSDVLATLRTYPQGVLDEAADLLDKLRHSTADQEARLAECESLARGGDVERGRMVFFGKEVACSACHRVGTDGGNVGPDLTRIGAVRSPRDLIESIVVPSSTFAQGYENYLVVTSDGRVASGVIASQSADTLVLHGASGKAQRFQKAHVEEMTRQAVSIMPDGLDRKLTSKQFQDLLTFLQSLK